MKTKAAQNENRILTETELELMNILWQLGEGSVNDVLAQLPKERKLAYTSVSTIIRILEQKGILSSRKEGRGHIYFPLVKKDDYETRSVQHLVAKVFDGEASNLVRRLIVSKGIKEDELEFLRNLLDEKLGKRTGK